MNNLKSVLTIISPFMSAMGFKRAGRHYFYISDNIAYCISLDAPSEIVYATAYIMPLYIPCEARYYTYGNRMNAIAGSVLPLLYGKADCEEVNDWCEAFCGAVRDDVLCFFREISTPEKLLEYVKQAEHGPTGRFNCPEVYLERLKVYTYLFLGDLPNTEMSIFQFRKAVKGSLFLATAIQQRYYDDIDDIDRLVHGNRQGVFDYCTHIIELSLSCLSRR